MSINWLKVIKHLSAKAKCEIGKDHKLQVSLQGVEDGTTSVGNELCYGFPHSKSSFPISD